MGSLSLNNILRCEVSALEFILDLIIEIKKISFSIGIVTWFRINKILSSKSKKAITKERERAAKIDAFLDKVIINNNKAAAKTAQA